MAILGTNSALGKLATAAVTGLQTAADKQNNGLSPSAVANAKMDIKRDIEQAIVEAPTLHGVAVVEVKSAWLSKINIGQVIGVAAMLFTLFGIDIDAETKAQIEAGIVAVMAAYTWVMKTFFTSTVTASSLSAA